MAASKSDKKQIIIVGVLLVAMLGVGAFQFSKPSEVINKDNKKVEDANIAQAVKDEAGTQPGTDNGLGQTLVATLPQQDPFTPRILDPALIKAREMQQKQLLERKDQELREAEEQRKLAAEQKRLEANSRMAPMDPNGNITVLPGTNAQTAQLPGNLESNEPPLPSYRLTGIILGDKPMAVLKNESGGQKLVRVGDKLQDERVVAIKKGKIVLEGQGQKRVLTL